MFFYISKILAFLITPLFWIMALLLWAIVTKSQTRRKWLLVIGFIVMYILSNEFLFNEVIRKWEGPVFKNSKLEASFDVGIVLGGFSDYDTIARRMQLNPSGDRIWQTLYLYKTGAIKKILITGGSGSILHKKITEADKVYESLVQMGVPEDDIIVEKNSRNTRENAVETAKILNARMPDAKCLLITSAFHMKRSMGCFTKVHLDVTPYGADYIAERRTWDPDKLFLPSPESLKGWNTLIREIIGYYAYKIAGYI